MITAAYVRVSTLEQANEGYSIEEQTDRIKAYCQAKGWNLVKIYTDPGASGGSLDRPAMQQLIQDCGAYDMVLVYKLDRLSRSQKDTLYLLEDVFASQGVKFTSMQENFDTSTPLGMAMVGILSAFAQLERAQIKERMSMGRVGRSKKGLWRAGSNAPIGYDYVDGHLLINEYEAEQIRVIFDRFLQGDTLNSIQQYMHEHYTNKYSSWNVPSQMSVVIRNPLYIGKLQTKDGIFDGEHAPIIDEATWYEAQKRYKEVSKAYNEHFKNPYMGKHLLSGLMYCGNCGARYFVLSAKPNGRKYSYYVCYSRDGNRKMRKADHCKNPNWRVEELDAVIKDEILKLDFKDFEIKRKKPSDPTVKQLAELDKQINKLIDLYQVGGIDIQIITEKVNALNEKKKLILSKKPSAENKLSLDEAETIFKKAKKIFTSGDPAEQKKIVDALIDKIIIEEDGVVIYWAFE